MSTNTNLVQMPTNDGKKRKAKEVKDTTASVWNPDWKYTPASETDLAKKFRRIQREQKLEAAKKVRRIK
jgi:hypothetical protein